MSKFDSEGVLAVITIIAIAGLIVFGLVKCSDQTNELKKFCIERGGTVIPGGSFDFRCDKPKEGRQ